MLGSSFLFFIIYGYGRKAIIILIKFRRYYPVRIDAISPDKAPANLDIQIMTGSKSFLLRNKATILYGISLSLLLLLLKWLELRFILFDHSFEIYIGFTAVIFTALGIWLALKLSKPKIKTVVVEKPVRSEAGFVQDKSVIARLGLSNRELEILNLLAQGHSNQEIASKLFVSLSTVKTHNQNLFGKLDVKRRIQAVEKAKRLNLIP